MKDLYTFLGVNVNKIINLSLKDIELNTLLVLEPLTTNGFSIYTVV